MNYLPLISTLVAFVFAVLVFRRFQIKGGAHLLMWSIGLVFYGLGTLSEVILSWAFDPLLLKIWYLSGAMLTAAWLGQGTLYLLIRRTKIVNGFTIGLVAISLLGMVLLFASPLKENAPSYDTALTASKQYKDFLSRGGGILPIMIILNIYGTVMLVGGALYSAYLFWRKKVLLNRVLGNILIAAGGFSPALAGFFVTSGMVDLLYPSELVGVILMYIGFQLAVSYRPVTAGAKRADAT